MKDKFADRIDNVDAEVLRELSRGKKRVFEFGTFVGGSAMSAFGGEADINLRVREVRF